MNTIEEAFGEGRSLYEVLEIPANATSGEIKKAYFRAALKCVSASSKWYCLYIDV